MVEEEEEPAEDQGSLTPSLGKQKPLLIHKLEEVVILAPLVFPFQYFEYPGVA